MAKGVVANKGTHEPFVMDTLFMTAGNGGRGPRQWRLGMIEVRTWVSGMVGMRAGHRVAEGGRAVVASA
jgi:hypothetical protein